MANKNAQNSISFEEVFLLRIRKDCSFCNAKKQLGLESAAGLIPHDFA